MASDLIPRHGRDRHSLRELLDCLRAPISISSAAVVLVPRQISLWPSAQRAAIPLCLPAPTWPLRRLLDSIPAPAAISQPLSIHPQPLRQAARMRSFSARRRIPRRALTRTSAVAPRRTRTHTLMAHASRRPTVARPGPRMQPPEAAISVSRFSSTMATRPQAISSRIRRTPIRTAALHRSGRRSPGTARHRRTRR